MTRTAVIITGSRKWSNWEAVRGDLARYPDHTIVIHGDASGADHVADRLAIAQGKIPWPLPYFGDLQRRGGPARNVAMVDVGLTLRKHGFQLFAEAYPLADSVGTWHATSLFVQHGIPLGPDSIVRINALRPSALLPRGARGGAAT